MNTHLSKLCLALLITTSIVAQGQNSHLTYEQWKETKIKQWGNDSSFIPNIQELLFQAGTKDQSREELLQQCDKPTALYAYNLLREKLEKSTIQSTGEIDEKWIIKTAKQLGSIAVKEELNQQGTFTLVDPEPWQKTIINEARKNANITNDQVIYCVKFPFDTQENMSFYVDQMSGANSTILMIAYMYNLDELLFHIYHELGHVKNNDTDPIKIRKKQYPAFEEEYYTTNNTIENFSKDFPKTNAHLELIRNYVDSAKKELNSSSDIGKRILSNISNIVQFWNAPNTAEQYIKTAIGRAIESRADLFACEHLFKQNKLDTLLYFIRAMGTADYVISDYDEHPSHVERGLYIAGYLISKGIDINKALHEFEQNWQFRDARQFYNSDNAQASHEEENDLIKAYKKLENKKQNPMYEAYKKQMEEQFAHFKHHAVSQSMFKIAVMYFDTWYELTRLSMMKKSEDRSFKSQFTRVAMTYNYLRELLNQPIIDSMDEIDEAWVNTAPYAFFKKEKEAEWNKKNIVNFKDRIKDLLSPESINPSPVTPPGLVFFNYNFARELQGKPTIQLQKNEGPGSLPFELDQNWIDEQLAQ